MFGLLYRQLLYRLKYRQKKRTGNCHRSFHGKIKTTPVYLHSNFVLSPTVYVQLHVTPVHYIQIYKFNP